MAPAVALAPRRDGTPLPGTSSGIGGRPHVALRQPLPRYARRAVSPNRVRPGEAGGFTIVRSARRGDKYPGARDEDDPPRVDDVRVDDGSIARLPRARRATGARLVAARRSPSPDRARSVRLRCLPPSDAAGHLAPDDDDDAAKDGASTPESGDATPSKDAGSESTVGRRRGRRRLRHVVVDHRANLGGGEEEETDGGEDEKGRRGGTRGIRTRDRRGRDTVRHQGCRRARSRRRRRPRRRSG